MDLGGSGRAAFFLIGSVILRSKCKTVSVISTMVRVEVQHADFANHHSKSVQSNGNSATLLILLSDDKTGFMPYRIDNFSMEVPSHYAFLLEFFIESILVIHACYSVQNFSTMIT